VRGVAFPHRATTVPQSFPKPALVCPCVTRPGEACRDRVINRAVSVQRA
jgi:hypothetical protein